MPTSKRIWSIRRVCLISIIGFVTLFSIISIAIITQQNTRGHQAVASEHIKYWAKMIVEGSREFLVNSERQALSDEFASTKVIPKLNYLHIYQINKQSQQAELFYRYKRNARRSAISEKLSEMPDLLAPRFKETFVEYMQPVKADGEIVGYVYLQNSTEDIAQITSELLTLSFIMMLVVILIAIFVMLQLERFISAPFWTLVNALQLATRQKNFQQPCQSMPYREADILARNLNILFSRMEKHIAQLNASGQESIEHSQALENKVNKRTEALKESNNELLATLEKLHQFQGQLVESEKMASLGDMVAGVAHEVNTPIGLGVTASTLLADRLEEVKCAFEDKTLKYIINTHYHGDHTGSNEFFSHKAPIFAHENVRSRLSSKADHHVESLPVVTYKDGITIYLANEEVQLSHLPKGHTDGDTYVYFKKANVLHTGDLFFEVGFPYIDLKSGGSVKGYLAAVNNIIASMPDDVIIIPGHGELTNKTRYIAFANMIDYSIKRVEGFLAQGKTEQQILALGIGKDYQQWSWRFINEEKWLKTLINDLKTSH